MQPSSSLPAIVTAKSARPLVERMTSSALLADRQAAHRDGETWAAGRASEVAQPTPRVLDLDADGEPAGPALAPASLWFLVQLIGQAGQDDRVNELHGHRDAAEIASRAYARADAGGDLPVAELLA